MIRLTDIRKSFGSVQANRGAMLDVTRGEIHALVGENGAGKSTLMRILSGLFMPDSGRVEVDGRDVTGWNSAQAIAAGVGMVHQHFMLVPTLNVVENLILGAEPTRLGQLDMTRATAEVSALMRTSGLTVPLDRRVAQLAVGEAQRVEILKALHRGARILVLDEPTAVLSPLEVDELWRVLRRLKSEGHTIVLITHKLDEVMAVSDRVTVMRNGETVGRLVTAETSAAELARLMVGRDVALVERRTPLGKTAISGALLEVRNLAVAGTAQPLTEISFSIARGEILGVAGVEGNGQTELVETLAGLLHPASGSIELAGRDVTSLDVRARRDAGLAYIPEDRQSRGLILDYSVADNLVLGRQHHYTRRGTLDSDAIANNAAQVIREFDIRPRDPRALARALSGGNQQKAVVAREMQGRTAGGTSEQRDVAVLLAAQPTRGVDVGAIEFIHARLRAARDAGSAILLVSADLAEILALADRVAVMFRGRIVTIVDAAHATIEQLGAFMTGAERAA
jgi:general nucleoside transport system ATP-binding protein